MRKIALVLVAILITASITFAGDEMAIKAFDQVNLKHLNSILRQLQRDNVDLRNQIKTLNGGSVVVEPRQSGEMYVPQSNIVGFQGDSGQINLYVDQEGEQVNIGVPNSGTVHKTPAGQAIPSSYFLDLRGHRDSNYVWHVTADWLVLHDSSTPWNTKTLTSIDTTNDVSIAGPIAGGRDQIAAFSNGQWVHFFIIYDDSTGIVSSVSSSSSTAPTLPTGYTYWVRTSCVRHTNILNSDVQFGDRIYHEKLVLDDGQPSDVNVLQSLDISDGVPPTAKIMIGTFGLTDDITSEKGMAVASDSTGYSMIMSNFPIITLDTPNYFYPACAVYFELPLVTAQTLWWKASATVAKFGIRLIGFIDDL